jgi:hypothetical protein
LRNGRAMRKPGFRSNMPYHVNVLIPEPTRAALPYWNLIRLGLLITT